MKKLLRVLIPVTMALIMLLSCTIPALAATTAVVTVTSTPAFIGISISPTTYTLNSDNSGSGKVDPNTAYYSNPLGGTTAPSATVVDGECDFAITNTSTIATDLTGNMSDFSGGSDDSTNVNQSAGDNNTSSTATAYLAYAYYSGETFASKVLLKKAGSATGNFKSNLGATTNIKVGFQLTTQTDAWTGGTGATSTITITATAH